jgi:hypothetical protein
MELNSLTFLYLLHHFWNVLYQYKKVSDFISVTFEMFVSRQEKERV